MHYTNTRTRKQLPPGTTDMSQAKTKQEQLPKSGASRRKEMSTMQVKNTLLHLKGPDLKLVAKNGGHSKAPGHHLSPVHGKEATVRLTTSPQMTQEGTTQFDLLAKANRPVLNKGTENKPVRQPLKLAPLDLTEEVRQAQKQKLSHDVERKPQVKTRVNQCREKVAVSIEPLKSEKRPPPKPQLRSLEEVVCQGTPAPLFPKLTPNSPHINAKVATNQDVSKRRLRLTRAQCLEEDEAKSSVSTVALCQDKLAQGVQSRGQRQDRGPRGSSQSGKGISDLPVVPQETISVKKKSAAEDKLQVYTLNLERDHGSAEVEGMKEDASSWRLKRKKDLMTKHNRMVTLERLQH